MTGQAIQVSLLQHNVFWPNLYRFTYLEIILEANKNRATEWSLVKKVYFCQPAHKKSKMASTVFYHPCFLTISPTQRDFHESEQMYFYTDKICTYYFLWK